MRPSATFFLGGQLSVGHNSCADEHGGVATARPAAGGKSLRQFRVHDVKRISRAKSAIH